MATGDVKSDQGAPHPFLKWAGGKSKLVPELLARVPADVATYYEPFLGGGALFFALRSATRGSATLRPVHAVLSDVNYDLVTAYQVVRDDVRGLVRALGRHAKQHQARGLDYYLEVRASVPKSDVARAARLVYLNKTCFNGLWRVNKQGKFNVPMGRFRTPPTICDEENLYACSEALRGIVRLRNELGKLIIDENAAVVCLDFREILPDCVPGDFVYLDPPYYPLSETSSFTAYAKEGFGPAEQRALADEVLALDLRGVDFLLSSPDCPAVRELYQGFKLEEVTMRRNINSVAARRGPVGELLVSGVRSATKTSRR